MYDVIIVGGGPSGAALGISLARGGASVLILERNHFPREKACGGLVSGRCAGNIDSIFGEHVLDQLCRASSTGYRVFYKNQLLVEGTSPEKIFFVRRNEMDALLVRLSVEAGCRLREGCRAVEVDPLEPSVRLACGEVIRGKVIAGADGVNSVLGKCLKARRWQSSSGLAFGLVADLPWEDLSNSGLREACARAPHFYFGVVPWGYGWVFPRGESACIGIGGLLNRRVRFRSRLEALVAEVCRAGTWPRLRVRGHLVPFGNFERSPGYGKVVLVGDAAGLVEPITGEGLGFALESSRLAATAILEALSNDAPSQTGGIYNAAYRRQIMPHFVEASLARQLLFPKLCFPFAMRALRHHPRFVPWYLDIVSGKTSYRNCFWRVLKEVLTTAGSGKR
jgi:geranylgeranyl reductase family protein